MKVEVIKVNTLENIPSASGIEIIDGIIYIIGDDVPYLYKLDHHLTLLEKIELFSSDFQEKRIPKSLKPDFESITRLEINNNNYLLILGSGSTLNRDKGYLVKLPTRFNKKHFIQELDLRNLYNLLRSNPEISSNGILNIEGVAMQQNNLILLNRTNSSSQNTALIFDYEEFIIFLTENNTLVPFPQIVPFSLPKENNLEAGFSGATILDQKLLFTATLENTNDAVNDGEVLGSFIGYFEINLGGKSRLSKEIRIPEVKDIIRVSFNNKIYHKKIESIAAYEIDNDGKVYALAVTDDDKGGSEILMLEVSF